MKLVDCYRIALHNIYKNKSRSVLTTIIVYLMSIVIMGLLFVSISFAYNLSSINNQYIHDNLDYVTTEYSYYLSNVDNAMSKNHYIEVSKCLNKNQKLIDLVKYESNSKSIIYTDFRFPLNNIIDINEGNYPDLSKVSNNHAIVSNDYIAKYKEDTEIDLSIGDNFKYSYIYFDSRSNTNKEISLDLVLEGIYESKDKLYVTSSSSKDSIVSKSVEIIVDVGYAFNCIDDLKITGATFYSSTKSKEDNIDDLLKQNNKFVDEMNIILPKITTNGKVEDTVYSITLEDSKIYNTINLIANGVTIFISVILILLSMGSLSNTIMISVNKNKKFIGLLKAMGIKEKDLESIIRLESVTTITAGVLLSFITIFLLRGVLVRINEKLIYTAVSYLLNEIDYIITFKTPLYIPLVVVFFFIGLIFIFSRKSIRKIANQDPISVISEVS